MEEEADNIFCSSLFVPKAPYTVPGIFTLCTIFGRIPGFEPELIRPPPGVLPMSFTHPHDNMPLNKASRVFFEW